MRTNSSAQRWLAIVVIAHLIISFVHGAAHSGARISMPLAANLYIWIVILLGPLAGLGLSRSRPAAGGWVVAATMAGSLVFGIVNHFVIASPDYVSHVAAEWRTLFGVTAALLVVSELAGVAAAVTSARRAARGFSESFADRASRFDSRARPRSQRS
jgi:hypothetical protein